MDTLFAFAMGEMNRGRELKVFDWDKAARLIKERKPEVAEAGLQNDFEWTGDTIWENGKPVKKCCTYLASTWATPILVMDGDEIPCYVMEHETKWDEDTKWPKSALEIVGQDEVNGQPVLG